MASKLLLNALKAKIVSNPFASPPAGQQQDDPAAAGQVVGDFHLTPTAGGDPAGQTGGPSGGNPVTDASPPTVSPSALAPAEALNLKALVPVGDTTLTPTPSLATSEPAAGQPALAVPEGGISLQKVEPTIKVPATGPALESVATSDAVVFPQLTLETDRESEELTAKVKALEGQKRKLMFKRFLPRVAGFAVLVLMALSASALSSPSAPGGTIKASILDTGGTDTGSTTGTSEQVTAMRYFIEVARVCPMDPPVRTKLQQQLREETNGLTVNEAIAYWVFACNHPLEAYVDRGFGPWAKEHGIVARDDEVFHLLTRSVMQRIFATQVS